MRYLTDGRRHLICEPYSVDNLHAMALALGIKRCWFHVNHYDIPKRRVIEIEGKCEKVTSKEIVQIITGVKDLRTATFESLQHAKENDYDLSPAAWDAEDIAVDIATYDVTFEMVDPAEIVPFIKEWQAATFKAPL